jgi:hypothetical protein
VSKSGETVLFLCEGNFARVCFLCVTLHPVDVDISRPGSLAMASPSEIRFIGIHFTRMYESSNMTFFII